VVLRRQRPHGAGEIDAFAAKADARVVYFTAAASRAAAAMHAGSTPCLGAERHGAQPCAPTPCGRTAVAGQVAALIFTSGTTGEPKGVMLTHDALIHFARVTCEARALARGPQLCLVPMTHIFGLGTVLLSSLLAGAQLVMRPQFDPADLLDALAHTAYRNCRGRPRCSRGCWPICRSRASRHRWRRRCAISTPAPVRWTCRSSSAWRPRSA
jgi:acyl-CoA synthetase (AMP-forming)/AMP-acid ligase II